MCSHQAFQFIEAAPLLCVLGGFLSELNAFFLSNESIQREDRSSYVDEDYVSALEFYCLLKQYLLDIKHNWGNVMTVALALPTNVKYASELCMDIHQYYYHLVCFKSRLYVHVHVGCRFS